MSKGKVYWTRKKRRQFKMKTKSGGVRIHVERGGRTGSVFAKQLASRRPK